MYVCLQKPANKPKVHVNGNIYVAVMNNSSFCKFTLYRVFSRFATYHVYDGGSNLIKYFC